MTRLRTLALVAASLLLAATPRPAAAYSVQTHEQLIDLTWKASIVPLLRDRFPGITNAQLAEAHSYAYGGCAIQDIGYYPFGNDFFSDLTHYVRAGDFVDSLLRNARTPDEVAFAIGALSHYLGDSIGHSEATNPSVAAQFPTLARKFHTASVTYEENPHDHVRVEFAFDINEIAKRRFAPHKYLDHVGLNVSTGLLKKAFFETYGLELDKTLKVERTTLFGYRFSVRNFLPHIAYAETLLHRNGFPPDIPSPDLAKLEADLRQAGKDNLWEQYRSHPGLGTYTLAGLITVMPPIGPLAELRLRGPNEDAETRYIVSVNNTVASLRAALERLHHPPPAVGPPPRRQTRYPNLDLDTGALVRPGSYRLTDETYAKLLKVLTRDPRRPIPVGLEEDILAYYANPAAPIFTKRHPAKWAAIQAELPTLRHADHPSALTTDNSQLTTHNSQLTTERSSLSGLQYPPQTRNQHLSLPSPCANRLHFCLPPRSPSPAPPRSSPNTPWS
jgi:hypothetical protein